MNEHVVAAVVRLNEAEALCGVEPLNCSGSHFSSPRCANARCACTTFARARSDFSDVLGRGAGSARSTRQIDYSNGRRLRHSSRYSKQEMARTSKANGDPI